MTRAEAAVMFYRLLRDKDVEITTGFPDVPEDAWYATAVNTLASLGVIYGYKDGTFGPEDPITRAQLTAIGMRFAYPNTNGANPYNDVSEDDWFYQYVVDATTYGWIEGYSDGSFRPNAYITRAHVTAIVDRMLDRAADGDYVENHADQVRFFPDVPASYWAYSEIVEATNSHDYTRATATAAETWTATR
jgi:hypothetical protein